MSTPGGNSHLDDSVLEFIGKLVCARPVYGWGWSMSSDKGTNSANSVPVEIPILFQFRIAEYFDWNGERRGGIGHIEEPEHIYDGYWLLFYTRHVGCFDFSSRIADYNFHIGRNQPSLFPPSKNPQMAEAWPLPNFPNCSSVWGFGRIGMTGDVMTNFEEERLKKWKLERDSNQK
jgi:hypothetical protein